MNDVTQDGTVNSRIVDSVASVVTLNTGEAPSQAFGMLDAVMVESLGMAMHNAVMRQQGSSMIGTAAVTAACAKMLQRQTYYLPPDPPEPPPEVQPILGPTPPPTPVDIAYSDGEAAINELRAQAASSESYAAQAREDLVLLAADAVAPLPPPPPPPDPFASELNAGEAVIAVLKAAVAAGGPNAAQAQADLAQLAKDAGAPAPPPPDPFAGPLSAGEAAIATLRAAIAAGGPNAAQAQADLAQLAKDAAPTQATAQVLRSRKVAATRKPPASPPKAGTTRTRPSRS